MVLFIAGLLLNIIGVMNGPVFSNDLVVNLI